MTQWRPQGCLWATGVALQLVNSGSWGVCGSCYDGGAGSVDGFAGGIRGRFGVGEMVDEQEERKSEEEEQARREVEGDGSRGICEVETDRGGKGCIR